MAGKLTLTLSSLIVAAASRSRTFRIAIRYGERIRGAIRRIRARIPCRNTHVSRSYGLRRRIAPAESMRPDGTSYGVISRKMTRRSVSCRIVTVLAVILEISATKHWYVTENGRIQPQVSIPLFLNLIQNIRLRLPFHLIT